MLTCAEHLAVVVNAFTDGVLDREEVKVAVAIWYTHVEEQREKKSSACTIL